MGTAEMATAEIGFKAAVVLAALPLVAILCLLAIERLSPPSKVLGSWSLRGLLGRRKATLIKKAKKRAKRWAKKSGYAAFASGVQKVRN